jgi:hypothetical protein
MMIMMMTLVKIETDLSSEHHRFPTATQITLYIGMWCCVPGAEESCQRSRGYFVLQHNESSKSIKGWQSARDYFEASIGHGVCYLC